MKKFLSLLLAALMVFALCAPAMAEGGEGDTPAVETTVNVTKAPGTITVNSLEAGDVIRLYKMVDAVFDEEKNTLTFYKVEDGSVITAALNTKELAQEYSADPSNLRRLGETKVEGTSATITTEELGLYLLIVKGVANVYSPMVANISPKLENNAWNMSYTDTVNAKKTAPSIDKKIADVTETPDKDNNAWAKSATVGIGDTVRFKITVDVPHYPENAIYTKYIVSDSWTQGLQFNKIESMVCYKNDETTVIKNDIATTDYTLTTGTKSFSIAFNKNCVLEMTSEAQSTTLNKLVIIYSATITDDIVISKDSTDPKNINTAKLTYSNDPYFEGDHEVNDEVPYYSFGLKVTKFTTEDGKKVALDGAEFVLKKDGTEIKLTGSDGEYKCDAENGTALKLTTKDGLITIDGLDAGTYTVTETKAPTGYEMLKDPVTVTIDQNGTTKYFALQSVPEKSDTNPNDGYSELKIENNKGFSMPATGGMGTTVFMVVGIALMAGVVVIMMVSNRKKANKAE